MEIKPIIAYIENDSHDADLIGSPRRDALSYFLREHCGFKVILYRLGDFFRDDLPALKNYASREMLTLVIVRQEFGQENEVIRSVRTELSENLPIVVIPDDWLGANGIDEKFIPPPDDKLIHVFDHTDAGLIDLVENIAASWKSKRGWLGATSKEDRTRLSAQLEQTYRSNLDDGDEKGASDPNHMVVAEALRLRLLPPELIKKQFDDKLEASPAKTLKTQPSVYIKEFEKIRDMNKDERLNFKHALMRAQGQEPAESGGVYVRRATCGSDINGFAIDPVTMETLETSRFGLHHAAADMLAHRIRVIEALKIRKNHYFMTDEEENACRWRIMRGLIYLKLDGFQTPILELIALQDHSEKDIRKVIRFLRKQQKYIPVNYHGQLIGD